MRETLPRAGDEALGPLLAAAGIETPLAEVKALIKGSAAAPEPHDPSSALQLVTPPCAGRATIAVLAG